MQYSDNLGMYLPEKDDYAIVKNLSDNFQKIDDAFGGGEDITSQLTYVGVSYVAGGVFKIGKLIIVQLRVQAGGSQISPGTPFIKGMPTQRGANGTNIVPLANNSTDRMMFVAANGDVRSSSDSSSPITANGVVFIGGCYITDD